MVLYREFLVLFGVAEQEVSEVVAGERAVKGVAALSLTEQVLDLLIESPTAAELDLMSTLGQRDVIADLVVIGFVVPRPAGNFKFGAGRAGQVDVRDAVIDCWGR